MKAMAYFAVAVVAVLNGSLGLAQRAESAKPGNSGAVYAALAKVPAGARAKSNPMANNLNALAAGKKLFQQHCAECHGSTAMGGRRGPSLRAKPILLASPGALFWILSNGVVRRGMPDWSRLPPAERWQIITYLKSLGAAGGSLEEP